MLKQGQSAPINKGRGLREQEQFKWLCSTMKRIPFLQSFSEENLLSLAAYSGFQRIAPGEALFREGERDIDAFFITCGLVMLQKRSVKGPALTLHVLGPHEPVGVLASIQGFPCPVSATALSEVVVLTIRRGAFVAAAKQEPRLAEDLLAVVASRMRDQHELFSRLSYCDSRARVAHALLLFLRYSQSQGGVHSISISRRELSTLAGITTATCIRITRAFERQGILRLPSLRVVEIVDREKLAAVANSAEEAEREFGGEG